MSGMNVTYLDHSGFAVALSRTLLVFDECNPAPAQNGQTGLAAGIVTENDLRGHETSLLFFSHSHSDHWCREAAKLPFSGIFLGNDFPSGVKGVRLAPGESAQAEGVTVRAFGSTDQGVSFLVDAEGRRIFHAGDLNLWHWALESTADEIRQAEQAFDAVLTTLLPYAGTIDLAFFPVDPRMGPQTARGAQAFLDALRPRTLIPMHLWNDPAEATRFCERHPDCTRLLTRRGASLSL